MCVFLCEDLWDPGTRGFLFIETHERHAEYAMFPRAQIQPGSDGISCKIRERMMNMVGI